MMDFPAPVAAVLDKAIGYVYSFGPIAEKTVILVPGFVKSQVYAVADVAGMDFETISYLLGLLACYPLGLIMLNIPTGNARHLFSFLLGAFLIQLVLGVQWIHHLITSLVAYAMMRILPRKTLTFALPVFAMAYLCMGHLHRQYVNYLGWDLDFTGCQMVLTQKLYMIGYNLYDGELLSKGIDNRAAKKCSKFALKEMPSLLEFLGYTFCFSSLLAGPSCEFSIYLAACDGSVFKTPDGKQGKVPSNVIPTLWPLFQSFCFLAAFLVLSPMFPILDPNDPQKNTPYILTDEFMANPWPYRYLHCWIGLFAYRQKYYFGWKNAEGANNIWYIGFDGFDEKGEPKGWETASNIDVLGFEAAPDVQKMSTNWNKKTSNWLSRYVYIRTGGSLIAVYSMSAFWHGFYPGYYIFFLSVPIATLCDRLAKKKLSPKFSKSYWSPYGLAGVLATTVIVNYMILPFVLLAGGWSIEVYKSHYFFGHILSIAYYFILSALPTPPKAEKAKSA